jgi:hypothetical protein
LKNRSSDNEKQARRAIAVKGTGPKGHYVQRPFNLKKRSSDNEKQARKAITFKRPINLKNRSLDNEK